MAVLWVLVLCTLAFTGIFGAEYGDFCGAGYYSLTSGRLWTLSTLQFPADTAHGFAINLCGAPNTTTPCDASAVLCSTGTSTVIGRRTALAIVSDNNLTLTVNYGLGDACGGATDQVTVVFHCQDALAGTFSAVQTTSNACIYTADVYVPTALCAPTPTRPAPFCQPSGYLSPTGRTWKLSNTSADFFSPHTNTTTYDWQLNICGQRPVTCNSNSFLCQGANSVGQRAYWNILDYAGNDTTLVVTYSFGDNCGTVNGVNTGDRRGFVFFYCTPGATNVSFSVTEVTTCRYGVYVTIPGSMCTGGGAQPTIKPPPFCEPAGYVTRNAIVYTLRDAIFGNYQNGSIDYLLNLCGDVPTTCGSDSVLCAEQTTGGTNGGLWTSWSFRPSSEYMGMSVQYTLGDSCEGTTGPRQTIVNFHCTGKAGTSFTVTEAPSCRYTVDVNVPPTMCGYASASAIVAPAPYCTSNGYYLNGRRWLLDNFNPNNEDPTYNYVFNLCGDSQTNCATNAFICQEGQAGPTVGPNSIGNRDTYNIRTDLSNSNTLVVSFDLGTYCASPISTYRQTTVYFQCQDVPAGTLPGFTLTESPSCVYKAVINVPTALCPRQEKPKQAPFCDHNYGYYSPTQRLWSLNGLTLSNGFAGYNLVLDVCGEQQNPCTYNSVLCQVNSPTSGYSVGDRNHYFIDRFDPLSSDTTLVVSYSLGDSCGTVGDRKAKIYFHCVLGTYTSSGAQPTMNYTEATTCVYKVDVYLPNDFCYASIPTSSPGFLPICNPNGYVDPVSRYMWNISDFNPETPQSGGGNDIVLNLCGTTHTLCDSPTDGVYSYAAVCQENSGATSLGSRYYGAIDTTISNYNTLAVYFTDGDYCTAIGAYRTVLIIYHCTPSSQTYVPSITAIELSTCEYVVNVNVPRTMCGFYEAATAAPVSPAPFCTGYGYKSPSNRLWTLANFAANDPTGSYNHVLNLCGREDTTWCSDYQSVLCQEADINVNNGQAYSLGARWTWEIIEPSNPAVADLTLSVTYGFGTDCGPGAGDRQIQINFHCIQGTYVQSFTLVESPTCRYTADINVPSNLCAPASNVPAAPFCTGYGYYSPTGRLWKLQNYNPGFDETYGWWNYQLNLCGGVDDRCPYGSVACQEEFMDSNFQFFSFGLRSTWEIDTTASCDDTIVINYSLGDWCDAASPPSDRTVQIRLHCNPSDAEGVYMIEAEPTICHYVIDAYVPPELCYPAAPTPAPPALPDYCTPPGYISSTDRAWLFNTFAPNGFLQGYDVQLNPCGNRVTTCDDGALSVSCQENGGDYYDGFSMGKWGNPVITEVNDLTLSVHYTNGDFCDAASPPGDRSVTINYFCSTDSTTNAPPNLIYTEPKICSYVANVTVPAHLCPTGVSATVPPKPAPWCTSTGYWSPSGELWKLQNYRSPMDQQGEIEYVLNLCGDFPTFCDDGTVVCQEFQNETYHSLGQRFSYLIIPTNDPTQLAVLYTLGDTSGCGNRQRSVFIYFHCTDDQGSLFMASEHYDGVMCNFRLDVAVPTSMCQLQFPTANPPPPEPLWCSAGGYLSPTGRQWLFSTFTPPEDIQGWDWTWNLCGNPPSYFGCASNVVACQSGYNLGLRSTWHINQTASNDTMLVVDYSLGDGCGANDRITILRFHCLTAEHGNHIYTPSVQEGPICVYTAEIWVPSAFCPGGNIPPAAPAPYCKKAGLYSNGRTWHLDTLTASDPFDIDGFGSSYDYRLDICGAQSTFCKWDTVMCQEVSQSAYWSLGVRSTWNIDVENSTADTLVVNYALGDNCFLGQYRYLVIVFQCADIAGNPAIDFTLTSPWPCGYLAHINVGTANCPQTAAPPALPPFCAVDGYVSRTQRRWTLNNLDVNDETMNYNYLLNLCGQLNTACPDDSVICQTTGDSAGYNIGARSQFGILPSGNDLILRTRFNGGDLCGGLGPRITYINFTCTNAAGPSKFTLVENPTCTYNANINVPTSMCQPASTISVEAPYCGAGYVSPTNRVWTLSNLSPTDPTGGYNYAMDLCGNIPTFCATGSVVCQNAADGGIYNLGSRFAWTVLPTSNDLTLVVSYGLGDNIYCGGQGNRYVVITFHCIVTGTAMYNHFTLTELPQLCAYEISINVPSSMCRALGGPTIPPMPPAAFCTGGYISDTGRVWTLNQVEFAAEAGYDYTLNLCGGLNTICDQDAVLCQSNGFTQGSFWVNTGSRTHYNIIKDMSDDLTLLVEYDLGEDCGSNGARKTLLRFHCGTPSGNTSSWNVTEFPTCTYTVDLYVPLSMCVPNGPTSQPVPLPDFCDPNYGYYSSYGQLWNLASFTAADPTQYYNYVLDLCGQQPVTCARADTAVCQEANEASGWNLGIRTAYDIEEPADNILQVTYGLGDDCGPTYGARQTWLTLVCQDSNNQFMTVVEGPTCRYNITVNVPTAYCPHNSPTPSPMPIADYCNPDKGYTSPSGRVWNLATINPNDIEGDYDYQLDLCGNFPTPCTYSSVFCQETYGANYNLGVRGSHQILLDDAESNDMTLVVSYSLGDAIYCDGGNDRVTHLVFHCTTQIHSTMKVTEPSSCHYRADVYVAGSLCGTTPIARGKTFDYCSSTGYISPTGRYWTMQNFFHSDMQGTYDFKLNLCGNSPTECSAASASAICQEAESSGPPVSYSLGNRYNFTLLADQSTDKLLAIKYLGGDYCDVINATREVILYLSCSDSPLPSIIEDENTTCRYTVTVQVPTKFCSTSPPQLTPTNPPGIDFCSTKGLPTGSHVWKLEGYNPNNPQLNYNYVFNLCGDNPTVCDGIPAICQMASEKGGWSVGQYNNYTIDVSQDAQGILIINYFGGDYCSDINDTRSSIVVLTCTDAHPSGFVVNETTECHYRVSAYVPTRYCGGNLALETSEKGAKLSSGAVAGITVGVVAVAAVVSAVGGIKLYQVRRIRRFQAQID